MWKKNSGAFLSGGHWSCGLLPRRVSLCRMQLPEARFEPSVRRGLGAERPSWLRGHGWGLGADGLRAPTPASPRRRTRVECDSGAGNSQQSSRAQGSRGSPAQLRHMESGGPVSKTDRGAFLSGGRWSCGLLPRTVSLYRMQLPEARFGPPVRRGLSAERPSWLRGHGWGPGRRRPSCAQSCLPTKENPWGVGFALQRPPAKQQGPGSQVQPNPASPYGERRARG